MDSACICVDRCNSARSKADTPRVLIVDDDVSVRESLELLMRSAGWQAETFASAEEFLARPRPTVPSCLVLDYMLPELDGLGLQKRIAADAVRLPIVFITCHGNPPMAVQAMKAGALDILMKPFGDDELLCAVQKGIERSAAALRRERDLLGLRRCYASLSPRERQVMGLVVTGRLNKQVGSELRVTEITVKAHRGRVMRKMQARSIADLINMAIRLEIHSASEPWTAIGSHLGAMDRGCGSC
jgi:FixJ family two-component response regulator